MASALRGRFNRLNADLYGNLEPHTDSTEQRVARPLEPVLSSGGLALLKLR
jgi:hypothetical protein